MAKLNRRTPWDEEQEQQATAPQPVATLPTTLQKPESRATRRINFDVTEELHRRIRVKAAGEGLTVADIGRQLLESWANE